MSPVSEISTMLDHDGWPVVLLALKYELALCLQEPDPELCLELKAELIVSWICCETLSCQVMPETPIQML